MQPFLTKTITALGLCFLVHLTSPAQVAFPAMTVDGAPVAASVAQEQDPIHHGSEYWPPTFRLENGIFYYKSDSMTTGDMVYYNRSYKNVPLMYDQVSDELITLDISGGTLIRLFNTKVDSFRIYNTTFIYFPDTTNVEKQGFWEVLVNANTKLLKREIKFIEEREISFRFVRVINPHIYYRILHRGVYHDVRDKESLLKIFTDKKDQMDVFFKSNRRRFRKADLETVLSATTTYYNELTAAQ